MNWQRLRGAIPLAVLACGLSTVAVTQAGGVDLGRSRIYVFVGKTGAGHDHGVEGTLLRGELVLSHRENPGSLIFDLKSLSADTPSARKVWRLKGDIDANTRSQVTSTMLSGAVLDTARFPSAEFVVQKVQALPADPKQPGEQPYQLDGELNLHGIKRPVQFNAMASEVEGMTRLRGTVDLKQTQFGIKPYTKLFGAVGVADTLRVSGEIWIRP